MTTDRHAYGPLEIPEPLVWRTYRSMSAAGPWRILTYTERAEVVLTLHTGPATDPGAFPPVEVLSYTVDLLERLDEQHRDARTEAASYRVHGAAANCLPDRARCGTGARPQCFGTRGLAPSH